VREPEGIPTPLPGRVLEKSLAKRLRTRRSQCRGRGSSPFTSTERARSEAYKWYPGRSLSATFATSASCLEADFSQSDVHKYKYLVQSTPWRKWQSAKPGNDFRRP
jgi:hypothetical protein